MSCTYTPDLNEHCKMCLSNEAKREECLQGIWNHPDPGLIQTAMQAYITIVDEHSEVAA